MNKKIKTIVLLILLILFVFSAIHIYNYWKETSINNRLNEDLVSKAVTIENNVQEEKVSVKVDFLSLKQENNDIIGWIYSEDTPINYPVVQGTDNEEYVHTLVNKKKGTAGTLFMDYRNNSNMEDNNTIIYGHSMKNGTMFGTIKKYRNQDYYDNNKIMYYITPEKSYRLELFAGYTTTKDSELYDLNQLDPNEIYDLKKQSNFKSDIVVKEGDKILTLSTCAYDYEDARYVLMGVLREV